MEAAVRRMMAQTVWNFSACPTWEDFILNIVWRYIRIGRSSLPDMRCAVSRVMDIVTEWEESGKCEGREGGPDMPLTAEAPAVLLPDHELVWEERVTAMLGAHVPSSPEAWLTQLLQRKRYRARDARN